MKLVQAAILAAMISVPAFAQASQETLADAMTSALESNPGILSQRKTRQSADEVLEQAKAAMRPTLSFSSTYSDNNDDPGRVFPISPRGSSPASGDYQRGFIGLEARQSLYAGGSLSAQRRQAEYGVNAAKARLTSFEQQLLLDVVGAFFDVRRGEQEVEIRETTRASLQKQVEAANDRLEAGEVTRTDVAQAQARRAGAEADLASAIARLAGARANFQRLVGRPAVQLAEPQSTPSIPASLDDAVRFATANNPELISARAQEQAAREAVKVARGALLPSLSLSGNAGLTDNRVDNAYRDTNLGVTARLSVPIYQGGVASSRTRSAQINADKARLDELNQERAVVSQVTSAWNNVISARRGIEASLARVSAAETALDAAQQELGAGTRTTLDVLDQERELLDARLGLVDARRSEFVYIAQLLGSLGQLNADAFGH